MAGRSSALECEVRWVEAAVSQQAEAVWKLLYADAHGSGSTGTWLLMLLLHTVVAA